MAEEIKIGTLNISKLFEEKSITIPDYQRPYKWKEKNVIQLLNDILNNMNAQKAIYRIGTVILHVADGKYHIVDGQQRLVTLTLILKHLATTESLPLLSSQFPHDDSKNNILQNYEKIKEWFLLTGLDNEKFKNYILNSCEFVKIELTDISEAFQLFDSQNARGKPLEPYDLLKAFHLREMNENTEEERMKCVKQWENAVSEELLDNLGKYIFRIRKWARGENAGYFTKDDIEEFKGMNLHQHYNYPYLKSFLLNDVFVNQLAKDETFQRLASSISFPFQLTQLIINGKRFFEYVSFYVTLHKDLFDNNPFYKDHCQYEGSHRTGDGYVREMFESALMYYIDKFGKGADFEENQRILYRWCYILRLKQNRVSYASIDKYVRDSSGNHPFKLIAQSYYHKDIKNNLKINIPEGGWSYSIPEVKAIISPQTI